MTQKPPGVKCDIVNECQMFLKAEDGGGDAHLKITDSISTKIDGKFTHSIRNSLFPFINTLYEWFIFKKYFTFITLRFNLPSVLYC